MISQIENLFISPGSSIKEAICCIDQNERQIALVVDQERRLVDTITDGDIRRAVLSGIDLDSPVKILRKRKEGSPYLSPITALEGTVPSVLLQLMEEKCVRQIPIVDKTQRVVDLITLRDILKSDSLPIQAVIMAGGYGTRLRPLTENIPKTMLKVGDKPLLESIVQQLRDAGIRRVNLTTHYKSDVITNHFGDGKEFGVDIRYVKENQPLGTAGALSLLESKDEPLLVINGDILTQVDFRAMLEFHTDHKADMTVAVRSYEHQIPYGVIESDGVEVTGIYEKPFVKRFVNAGIYLLNPEACRFIPDNQSFDMTDLISSLIGKNRRVICFPVREYWLDIGRFDDYEKAQNEYNDIFNK